MRAHTRRPQPTHERKQQRLWPSARTLSANAQPDGRREPRADISPDSTHGGQGCRASSENRGPVAILPGALRGFVGLLLGPFLAPRVLTVRAHGAPTCRRVVVGPLLRCSFCRLLGGGQVGRRRRRERRNSDDGRRWSRRHQRPAGRPRWCPGRAWWGRWAGRRKWLRRHRGRRLLRLPRPVWRDLPGRTLDLRRAVPLLRFGRPWWRGGGGQWAWWGRRAGRKKWLRRRRGRRLHHRLPRRVWTDLPGRLVNMRRAVPRLRFGRPWWRGGGGQWAWWGRWVGRRGWSRWQRSIDGLRRGDDARGVRRAQRLSFGVRRSRELQLPGARLLRAFLTLRRWRPRAVRVDRYQLRASRAPLRGALHSQLRQPLLRGVRAHHRVHADAMTWLAGPSSTATCEGEKFTVRRR